MSGEWLMVDTWLWFSHALENVLEHQTGVFYIVFFFFFYEEMPSQVTNKMTDFTILWLKTAAQTQCL